MNNYLKAYKELGQYIDHEYTNNFDDIAGRAFIENPWFSRENVALALKSWTNALTEGNIEKWLSGFEPTTNSKVIGVVAAGNIPLVGLHDMLTVLASGHHLAFKKSQNDKFLIDLVAQGLKQIDSSIYNKIEFADRLNHVDAVIATGSNNTARYFEHYFSKVPNVIRKNRTSVAILDGTETENDLHSLATDVFSYFGMGCRNVAKLYLPIGFDLMRIFPIFESFDYVCNNNKYMNNYDYNKAIYLMNLEKIFDTGNLLFVESKSLHSNVSVLNFEYYESLETVQKQIFTQNESIQCVVRKNKIEQNEVAFGQTQHPDLWDYADGVNTLQFLSKI